MAPERRQVAKKKYEALLKRKGLSLLSDYTRVKEYHDVRCPKGHVWSVKLCNLTRKSAQARKTCGCPKCGVEITKTKLRYTHAQYVSMLAKKNLNVVAVGMYKGMLFKSKHRCTSHDVIWKACPSDVLKGSGCQQCKRDKIGDTHRLNHWQYLQRLRNANPSLRALGTYTRYPVPFLHRCRTCRHEWSVSAENTLHNKWACPSCFPAYGYKPYVLGSRIVQVRGYEPQGLDYLRRTMKLRATQIKVASEKGAVPRIPIGKNNAGGVTYHTPDIYVPHLNLLVEVKSTATFGFIPTMYSRSKKAMIKRQHEVLRRRNEAERVGYVYRILVMTDDGRALKWKHRIHRSFRNEIR